VCMCLYIIIIHGWELEFLGWGAWVDWDDLGINAMARCIKLKGRESCEVWRFHGTCSLS
jgi:hypothetical protein